MTYQKYAHFFFAVKLPGETKAKLKEYCEDLKGTLPFSRWVHHEDFHITLAFLGSAPEDKLQTAKKLAGESISNEMAFPVYIDRLGVFGNESSPRIFWCGTQSQERLQIIREKVFSACKNAGFQLETRPFKSHITIARKWAGNDPFQKSLLSGLSPFSRYPLAFTAAEIVLYRTHLDKTPKYESVAIFPLLVE